MKILGKALGGIFLSLFVTSAGANIIITKEPAGTGNNVVYNQQPSNQSGTTIFGNINSVGTLVQFTSTQTLVTPALGQTRIESSPDNILNNLTVTVPGFLFDEAVFNLDATANGSATIFAVDQFGIRFSSVQTLGASGQNFFHFTTANNELISSFGFTSTVGLGDVTQVRIGNTTALAVPGPIAGAGLPGLIAACFAMLGLARRRRKAAA